jgi:hypothetical protein
VDAAGASTSLSALVSGVYSAAVANGGTATSFSGLAGSMSTAVGGTSASEASGLLSSLGSDGLQGLSTNALDLNATLAMTAYTDAQDGLPSGTLTAAATAEAATLDPASSAQTAVQSAQANATTNTLDLLG